MRILTMKGLLRFLGDSARKIRGNPVGTRGCLRNCAKDAETQFRELRQKATANRGSARYNKNFGVCGEGDNVSSVGSSEEVAVYRQLAQVRARSILSTEMDPFSGTTDVGQSSSYPFSQKDFMHFARHSSTARGML